MTPLDASKRVELRLLVPDGINPLEPLMIRAELFAALLDAADDADGLREMVRGYNISAEAAVAELATLTAELAQLREQLEKARAQALADRAYQSENTRLTSELAQVRGELERTRCHHGWRGSVPQEAKQIADRCLTCGGQLFIGTGGWLTCSSVPGKDGTGGCSEPGVGRAIEQLRAKLDSTEAKLADVTDHVAALSQYRDEFSEGALERFEEVAAALAPSGERDACPNGLLPDGPTCPRCGSERGPSGIDGGTWVHVK